MGVKKKASVLPPVNAPKKIPGVYKAAPREEKKPRHQSPALNDAKMLNGDAGKVLCEHCHETKWYLFAMPICDQMKVTQVVSVQQFGRTVMYGSGRENCSNSSPCGSGLGPLWDQKCKLRTFRGGEV